MNKKKIDKETAIKSILKQLKSGTDKKSIWEKLGGVGIIPRNTFYRWHAEAEIKYNEFMSKALPIIEAKEIEALAEVAKAGILSKIERQRILSQIALGEIPLVKYVVCNKMIEEVEIVPNWSDRKNAIDILNKMDGSYIQDDSEDEHEFNGFDIQDV